jgi:hypothetical protein
VEAVKLSYTGKDSNEERPKDYNPSQAPQRPSNPQPKERDAELEYSGLENDAASIFTDADIYKNRRSHGKWQKGILRRQLK